nr:MAG TPA_asm: hypothetical protein [Caudoviricetes sp.]
MHGDVTIMRLWAPKTHSRGEQAWTQKARVVAHRC